MSTITVIAVGLAIVILAGSLVVTARMLKGLSSRLAELIASVSALAEKTNAAEPTAAAIDHDIDVAQEYLQTLRGLGLGPDEADASPEGTMPSPRGPSRPTGSKPDAGPGIA